ncbi:DUF6783 domain-containing protein [Otoolea muris]
MWHKYTAKWGVQMPGMNFQTRSSYPDKDAELPAQIRATAENKIRWNGW